MMTDCMYVTKLIICYITILCVHESFPPSCATWLSQVALLPSFRLAEPGISDNFQWGNLSNHHIGAVTSQNCFALLF